MKKRLSAKSPEAMVISLVLIVTIIALVFMNPWSRMRVHAEEMIVENTNAEKEKTDLEILIDVPAGWHKGKIDVVIRVEDRSADGKCRAKKVMAKVGAEGQYKDITNEMNLQIYKNCVIYIHVTDNKGRNYERSREIKCFDTTIPTLNAAVSDGLLTIHAVDTESGVSEIDINGYKYKDIVDGKLNVRLAQFDAGYEYFTITATDDVGNVSKVYKTANPYYKAPESEDDEVPAAQLPVNVMATKPSSAVAKVTEHTVTDADGNTVSHNSLSDQKKAAFAQADAEEAELSDDESLGKEFYTVEAESGKVFYLIIDRDEEEEVVYFLTEISENDLLNVTSDNSETLPKNSAALESQVPVVESALPNNNYSEYKTETEEVETEPEEETPESTEEPKEETKPQNPMAGYLMIGCLGAAVIGAAYYFKVVRKKDVEFEEDEDADKDESVEYDTSEPEPEYDSKEKDPNEEFFNQDFDTEDVTKTVEDTEE